MTTAVVLEDNVLAADALECELVDRLTHHPVLLDIESMSQEAFIRMLLQRRFLSLTFAPVYDIGIDGLSDPTAIRLVRQILREEYPGRFGRKPSHREELVRDLVALGATKDRILAAQPTAVTRAVIGDTLELARDAACAAGDLKVMTLVRFWGEVLVAVEYGEYWKRIASQFDAAGLRSRFYYVHYRHDGHDPIARASARSPTHSGRLGACLKRLLSAQDALESFAAVETQVVDIRARFYDQFMGKPTAPTGQPTSDSHIVANLSLSS